MKKNVTFSILLALFFSLSVSAQSIDSTERKSKFIADVGIDILNNFIWRGIPLDRGPNLQPTLVVGYGNLKLSFLGSYSFKYEFNNIMTL